MAALIDWSADSGYQDLLRWLGGGVALKSLRDEARKDGSSEARIEEDHAQFAAQ